MGVYNIAPNIGLSQATISAEILVLDYRQYDLLKSRINVDNSI